MDGIQGFWFKGFTSQHQRLTEVLNENIQSFSTPSWLVKSRTFLIQTDSGKGNAVSNYRPIGCLNLLWKLKTGITPDKFYQHLKNEKLSGSDYHIMHAFQSESTLHSCLNIKNSLIEAGTKS